jgi:hypothetical protein
MDCHVSIFFDTKISSSLNIGSISLFHYCPVCQKPLISAKDMELKQITDEAEIKLSDKVLELERLTKLN